MTGPEDVLQRWRAALARTATPESLLLGTEGAHTWLDLTHAHPSGLAQLMAGRPPRLPSLVRAPGANQRARRRARGIRGVTVELATERGIRSGYLAAGIASWRPGPARVLDLTTSGSPVSAPVLLRGCALIPRGIGHEDFDLDLDDMAFVNPELLRRLSTDFGVRPHGEALVELAFGRDGFDPYPVFRRLEDLCRDVPGFRVEQCWWWARSPPDPGHCSPTSRTAGRRCSPTPSSAGCSREDPAAGRSRPRRLPGAGHRVLARQAAAETLPTVVLRQLGPPHRRPPRPPHRRPPHPTAGRGHPRTRPGGGPVRPPGAAAGPPHGPRPTADPGCPHHAPRPEPPLRRAPPRPETPDAAEESDAVDRPAGTGHAVRRHLSRCGDAGRGSLGPGLARGTPGGAGRDRGPGSGAGTAGPRPGSGTARRPGRGPWTDSNAVLDGPPGAGITHTLVAITRRSPHRDKHVLVVASRRSTPPTPSSLRSARPDWPTWSSTCRTASATRGGPGQGWPLLLEAITSGDEPWSGQRRPRPRAGRSPGHSGRPDAVSRFQ
jgi:hypothetical protein